jgi:hypothetical protein
MDGAPDVRNPHEERSSHDHLERGEHMTVGRRVFLGAFTAGAVTVATGS